jgi:hypothetical protein
MASIKTNVTNGIVAVLIAAGSFASGQQAKQKADVGAALDTMIAQEKIVLTPNITNDLATSINDSNVAVKTRIVKRFTDSVHFVFDTITRPVHPALKGFSDETGSADYAMAYIMRQGIQYRLLLIEADSVVDAMKIKPKKNDWLLSVRPTVTLH